MGIFELILTGVALSMDAFAISVCKALAYKKYNVKSAVTVGAYFGISQGVMPVIGYFLASLFAAQINAFDHWIAFVLLAAIGSKMVYDSFKNKNDCEEENFSASMAFSVMFPLAIATSIDALAVSIGFAFLSVNIFFAALVIGTVTFLLSMVGFKVGTVFGNKYQQKATRLGGIILVAIGLKILIEHLYF